MLFQPNLFCWLEDTFSLDKPSLSITYSDVIIAVSLLVKHHWGVWITLPLSINYVLVLVCPWMQSHQNSKVDIPIFFYFSGQMIISLPLLPASLDHDILWKLFLWTFPNKACLFSCTWTVMFTATFWTNLRHWFTDTYTPVLLFNSRNELSYNNISFIKRLESSQRWLLLTQLLLEQKNHSSVPLDLSSELHIEVAHKNPFFSKNQQGLLKLSDTAIHYYL